MGKREDLWTPERHIGIGNGPSVYDVSLFYNNNLQFGALSSVGRERLPYNPFRGDVIRGKKSSKFNQDCTICPSCRNTQSDSAVPKTRENRNKMAGIRSGLHRPARIHHVGK